MKSLSILATSIPLLLAAAPAPAGGLSNIVDTAVAAGRFDTLVKAVQAAGLEDVLDGPDRFTVFAPTDAAFEKLPPDVLRALTLLPANQDDLQKILLHHVMPGDVPASQVVQSTFLGMLSEQRTDVTVQGSTAFIDGARIQVVDIPCSNGIIHVIDAVLIPNTESIVGTAVANDDFDVLVAAVAAADLVDLLDDQGPFTVFAPTDQAFLQLGVQSLRRLLAPGLEPVLTDILAYHVVDGRLYAEDVVQAGQLTTLLGATLQVSVMNGDVFINGARVVLADVETCNGNIHVIDSVLLP